MAQYGNETCPDDNYVVMDAERCKIRWVGYPGAIVASNVKTEDVRPDGNRVVTTFDGRKYNVHPVVRECGQKGMFEHYYIREGCFPIRWEIL